MEKKRLYYIAPIFALCIGLLPGIMFSAGALRREKASAAVGAPALSGASVRACASSALSQMRDIPISISGISAENGVYNGAPHPGYSGTPKSLFTGEYELIYTGRGSTGYGPSETPPADAGLYTVTFLIPGEDPFFTGSASLNFSIEKASPAGAPQFIPLTEAEKTLSDAALSAGAGDFETEGTVSWARDGATEAVAGAPYTWIFTPADSRNYVPVMGVAVPYIPSHTPDEGAGGEDEGDPSGPPPRDDGDITSHLGKTVTLGAEKKEGASYQWQVDKNDGGGWSDIPDATEAEYVTPPLEEDHFGYVYRCAITDAEGTEYSLPYTVPSVNPPQTGGLCFPWAALSALSLSAAAALASVYIKRKYPLV